MNEEKEDKHAVPGTYLSVEIIAVCRSLFVACLSCRQNAVGSVPPTT